MCRLWVYESKRNKTRARHVDKELRRFVKAKHKHTKGMVEWLGRMEHVNGDRSVKARRA